MRRLAAVVASAAAVLFCTSASAATTTISTLGSWNGTDSISAWGSGGWGTPTYGETILGNGGTLQSFTFYFNTPSDIVFRGGVYVWNGSSVGAQVWQSGDMTLPGSGMRPVTFNPNVTLAAGQEYVMLATTLFSSGPADGGNWGWMSNNSAYTGGSFVFTNQGTLTTPWDNFIQGDLAFTATLSGGGGNGDACKNIAGVQTGPPDTFYSDGSGNCYQRGRAAVCTKDGFQNVDQSQLDDADPGSPYYGASRAVYVQGYGLMCGLSDLASYGGDPADFADAGYRVDETGTPPPAEYSADDWGAYYEYYVKKA